MAAARFALAAVRRDGCRRPGPAAAIAAGGALALWLLAGSAAPAEAQQVYRIVGPDGRVSFSDKPPAGGGAAAAGAAVASAPPAGAPAAGAGPGIDTGALPYDLRQVVQRYPVTLYTGQGCAPCVDARNLLRSRGVPFVERTVDTAADVEALGRISGGNNLPYATIGRQALQGFSGPEWTQYLDLAGYPRQSQLPVGFRAPAASPLVAATPARPAAAPPPALPAARTASPAAPAAAPAPAPASNPAGIQF